MLNQVPGAINALSARIVHHHPNSIGCQMFRKRVTRENAETLGGIGVLSSEDEEQVEYVFLGPGSALPTADDGAEPALMNDNIDAPHSANFEFRFLIEPEKPSGDPEWFSVEKHDILLLWLMDDGSLKVPFEVIGVETVNNLPPFSVRYVCNRRDDLLWAMNDLEDPADWTPPDDADLPDPPPP
jgi:hypothetical protein